MSETRLLHCILSVLHTLPHPVDGKIFLQLLVGEHNLALEFLHWVGVVSIKIRGVCGDDLDTFRDRLLVKVFVRRGTPGHNILSMSVECGRPTWRS